VVCDLIVRKIQMGDLRVLKKKQMISENDGSCTLINPVINILRRSSSIKFD